MRQMTCSVTRFLSDQIFTSPVHWDIATGFPKDSTHVVDICPGGVNGIDPPTSRNLEGRGVRVIILGNKGHGEVEIFGIDDAQ